MLKIMRVKHWFEICIALSVSRPARQGLPAADPGATIRDPKEQELLRHKQLYEKIDTPLQKKEVYYQKLGASS